MKKALISLVLVLCLVGIMVAPVGAAVEQNVGASVTVNEVMSITLTDTAPAGITFGSVDPGVTAGDSSQSEGTPAVLVVVGAETNCPVNIGIKGSTAGAIGLSNWKYSTSFSGAKTSIPDTYAGVYPAVAAGSSNAFYHWVSIPADAQAGGYSATIYYKAQSAAF